MVLYLKRWLQSAMGIADGQRGVWSGSFGLGTEARLRGHVAFGRQGPFFVGQEKGAELGGNRRGSWR